MDIKGVSSKRTDSVETTFILEQRTNDTKQNKGIEAAIPENTYSKEEITKELDQLNKWLEPKSSHLKFVLHDELNEYYVQVINDSTDEVINEIPSKKVMDMIANVYENLGLIVDKKV